MNDPIGGMLRAITLGEAPRLGEKITVDGLTVSTVDSWDLGYETTIIDANETYPVERYDSEAEALEGHARWVEKAKTLTHITHLGVPGLIEDKPNVELKRDGSE